MKKLKFFEKRVEILLFMLGCLFIFGLNLALKYSEFSKLKSKKYQPLVVAVQSSYLKTNPKGRTYRVFRLKGSDFSLYTTTKSSFDAPTGSKLELKIVTDKVKFREFVKGIFFAPSVKIKRLDAQPSSKERAIAFISSQHDMPKIKELYSALYFATPISKELRGDVNRWGISHLIAISGFHLGIIFASIFAIVFPIYKFFQNRYFPYRSSKFDITLAVLALLTGYLFVLDFTPSFLRSFVMCCIGFLFLVRNFEIVNFLNLFLTIVLCVSFFPNLAFSLGFYFSSLGVFYIFLFLKHFSGRFTLWQNALLLNIYVYFAMNIAVYYFFNTVSLQQISVILLSYIFIVFYPLSAVMHIFKFGYIFDGYLIDFLNFSLPVFSTQIPLALFILANLVSLLAIRYKFLALLPAILGVVPFLLI